MSAGSEIWRYSMAQKKKKHGKVEARQVKPFIRFKPGVLVLLVLIAFGGCFALYMTSALKQEDYWEKEIVGSMEQAVGTAQNDTPSSAAAVTNPVPVSERAEDSYLAQCGFVGDVTSLTTRYETTSGMIFTDSITGMSESRMRSIARSLASSSPSAVYLWYACPEDMESGAQAVSDLADALQDGLDGIPVYILTAVPSVDATESQRADTWNAALFTIADEKGLYYVDVSTTLKANDGTLSSVYQEEDALYEAVAEVILTHIAD